MADKSRKRKPERSAPVKQVEEQYEYSVARSDDGFDGEYPDGEYAMKRQRNNAAVNKTRQKKRQEECDTVKRVKQLREENAALERTVESLRQELSLLKEMVLSFASNRVNRAEPSSTNVSPANGKANTR